MVPRPDVALRRAVLAIYVLDDLDLRIADDGVLLTGPAPRRVSWDVLAAAVAGVDPESSLGRARVGAWLHGRRAVAEHSAAALNRLVRPVGLPVDHPLHPGPEWVRERVLGGALDVGLGFLGLYGNPDRVVIVPPSALAAEGIDPSPWWPAARDYLEQMGTIAAGRFASDVPGLLRPIGDCDVVTLLAARSLRLALCGADSTGMCAAAVPMRRRGWLDLTQIDPDFTVAAAAATDITERGFASPLLLTADEVSITRSRARPEQIVQPDPAG
jgi:hypothetical protein